MKIDLLKPMNGWRVFIGEVGIIVVGVMLALAAQEIAQILHWRREVAEARASLNAQLSESMFSSEERIKDSACYMRQLDRLDELIEINRPPQIYDTKIGALRLWSTSAWDAAVASGAIAQMKPDERDQYANLFAFTAAMRDLNIKEFETSTGLGTLMRHRKLTDVSRDRLAQEISRQKGLNSILALGARQWLEAAKGLDIRMIEEDRQILRRTNECVMPDTPPQG